MEGIKQGLDTVMRQPEHSGMYDISGTAPVSERSFRRYEKDKEQDAAITKLIEKSPDYLETKIKTLPEAEKVALIMEAMESPDKNTSLKGLYCMKFISGENYLKMLNDMFSKLCQYIDGGDEEIPIRYIKIISSFKITDRVDLLRRIMSKNNERNKIEAIDMLDCVDPETALELIKVGLQDSSVDVQRQAIEKKYILQPSVLPDLIRENLLVVDEQVLPALVYMIDDCPKTEVFKLSKELLNSKNVDLISVSVWALTCLPDREVEPLKNDILDLIKKNIRNPDVEMQEAVSQLTRYVPKTDMPDIIRTELRNSNKNVQDEAVGAIKHASEDDIAQLVLEGIKSDYPEVRLRAGFGIWVASNNKRLSLIRRCLEINDIALQDVAMSTCDWLGKDDREILRKIVSKNVKEIFEKKNLESSIDAVKMIRWASEADQMDLIKFGLESGNVEFQKKVVSEIMYIKEGLRASLVEWCINSDNVELQKKAGTLFHYVPKGEVSGLFKMVVKKGLDKLFIRPMLYEKNKVDDQRFSRQNFEKTGSETTLLGGELKGKSIIRTIEPNAFKVWQRLYEDYKMWQRAGFDYVPIEPIQSYRLNKNGKVDVFSGVLDLSLNDWKDKNIHTFDAELHNQRDKIIKTLVGLNVYHGHTHDNNFCLRFFRDKNGRPDFKRTPLIYLIDFDQVTSPEVKTEEEWNLTT